MFESISFEVAALINILLLWVYILLGDSINSMKIQETELKTDGLMEVVKQNRDYYIELGKLTILLSQGNVRLRDKEDKI